MSSPPKRRTQPTQPTKGEPVEIPVPKRKDVMRDLRKVAAPAEKPMPAEPPAPAR